MGQAHVQRTRALLFTGAGLLKGSTVNELSRTSD